MEGKFKPHRNTIIFSIVPLLIIFHGCSKKNDSSSGDTPITVTEIAQTVGRDGFYSGSFVIPSNGISFLLSIFKENNSSVAFYSLSDPNGTNILSASSTPTLYGTASGSLGGIGYANILIPQSPSFTAKTGKWSFKAYNNDRVKLILRKGSDPSNTSITVQPFITGTTWSADNITNALDFMNNIFSSNEITIFLNDTISINEPEYAAVTGQFTDSTTSSLVSRGLANALNIFFIEDYSGSWSGILGNAAGIPGSMRISNPWNGVLISLSAHASGTVLDSQLLGETAAHEMGHQVGLFHTSESGGTVFDILSDTKECSISLDNDSNGKISAEECEGYGAENVMFWTSWSQLSRSSGKKQDNFSSYQKQVIKFSPISR